MRSKVELLRAIEYTIVDLDNILNLDDVDDFSDLDKEFMFEFKKIYEMGLNKLEEFIDKLDEEGKDLDEYSIKYYVRQLLNGPLGQYARQLAQDKKYFNTFPDLMGITGNRFRSFLNTTVIEGTNVPLGLPVDHYNKLPEYIQTNLQSTMKTVEDFFRSNLKASTVIDNTLPLVDKNPQGRYNEEEKGTWVLKSNASYLIKDSYSYEIMNSLNQEIFEEIKTFLEEENYRLFLDNKTYTPFANDSTTSNYELERNENGETLKIDLMGNQIDGFDQRQSTLKVSNPEKDKEYILNSNEGQFGN